MSARSKTGGGVGTNQHQVKGRSIGTDPSGHARAAALLEHEDPDDRDRLLANVDGLIGEALDLIESGRGNDAHELLNRWRTDNWETLEQITGGDRYEAAGGDLWHAFTSGEAGSIAALIDHPNLAQAVRELPDGTRAKLDRIADTFEYGMYYSAGADDPRVSFDHATIDGPVFTDVRPPVRPYTDLYTAIARRLIGA